MKSYSYGERDYTFGQMMLTLRTNIGLTQADWRLPARGGGMGGR